MSSTSTRPSEGLFWEGVRHYRTGYREHALQTFENVLEQDPEDLVALIFAGVCRSGTDANRVNLFRDEEHVRSYRAIAKSTAVHNLHQGSINIALAFAMPGKVLRVLDVGIGPGRHMARLIREVARCCPGVSKLQLVGIDFSPEMLHLARENLEACQLELASRLEVDFALLKCRAEEIASAHLKLFGGERPDCIFSCIAIHSMPAAQKLATLRKIQALQPHLFVIADVNSDHDDHLAPVSDELIRNVRRFYGTVYRALIASTEDQETRQLYKIFCATEAQIVLFRPVDDREDYHTTVERWRGLLQEAGLALVAPGSEALNNLSEHAALRDDHLAAFTAEGEDLFFVLAAR